jgi:undecaprenyl pyrophosphate phosphatase UppP
LYINGNVKSYFSEFDTNGNYKKRIKKITIKIQVHMTLTVVHGRLSVKEIRTLFKVWLVWFGFMVCNVVHILSMFSNDIAERTIFALP